MRVLVVTPLLLLAAAAACAGDPARPGVERSPATAADDTVRYDPGDTLFAAVTAR
jgi:hypothetical protein